MVCLAVSFEQRFDGLVLYADLPAQELVFVFEALDVARVRPRLFANGRRLVSVGFSAVLRQLNGHGWSRPFASVRLVNNEEWNKLRREYEAKLMPGWVRHQIDQLEAELVAQRARCEKVERRDKVLQAQIAKEVEAYQDLKLERDQALEEAATLKATSFRCTPMVRRGSAEIRGSTPCKAHCKTRPADQ